MRETLLIRFAEPGFEGVDFIRLDEAGKPVVPGRHGSLTEAAMEATGRRVVVLVPAADLFLTRAVVPTGSRPRARKAVPFAVEEQVAEDIETLHFALGTRDADGHWPVAVIAQARMDAWLEQLHEAGILPDRFLPEPAALPLAPGGASLLLEEDRILLRDQPWSAQSATRDTLPWLLELLMARNESGIDLQVWHCGGDLPVWMEPVSARIEPCPDGPLGVLACGLESADHAIDLLQGAYSRKEQYGQLWRPWRAAAALLVAGVLLSAVQHGVNYARLKTESAELTAQIEQVYKRVFPQGRVVNPRVQMEQQLNMLRQQQGAGGNDFLSLIAQMGEVLTGTAGLELGGINFRDGRMDLELTANDVQTLDRLKQQLSEQGGLSVEIQSATTGADRRVQGRLRVQGAAS